MFNPKVYNQKRAAASADCRGCCYPSVVGAVVVLTAGNRRARIFDYGWAGFAAELLDDETTIRCSWADENELWNWAE